jgi:hypothetical protein
MARWSSNGPPVQLARKALKTDGKLGEHLIGDKEREVFRQGVSQGVAHFPEVFTDVDGGVEEFAVEEPFLKAALTPGAEVLWGDAHAVESLGDDFLDFGQGVEPGEDVVGFLAVVEADVEFVADGTGKAGDFAAALGGGGFGVGGGFADSGLHGSLWFGVVVGFGRVCHIYVGHHVRMGMSDSGAGLSRGFRGSG